MEDMISRKAAIEAFLTELTKRERKNLLHTWSTVEVKYFITKMLEQLPSAQPETHEERTETHACDYINRKDAIDAHYEYCNKHPDASFPVWSLKILEDLPSAQPDLSEYSDKLWKAAYERGKAEAHAEIVRCKDCIFHGLCRTSPKWAVAPKDDWYCADAERRTDE